jgi:hypothetical protein
LRRRSAPSSDEALAAPAGADDERRREIVGVERHAARLARNRVRVGADEPRLERLADLGQLRAPGHGDRAFDQCRRRDRRQARQGTADLDGHAAQLERTPRRRNREDPLEPAMRPRSQRSSAPQTRRGLTQDLGRERTRQYAQGLEP